MWAEVANSVLSDTGDEGRAVREANAMVAKDFEAAPEVPAWRLVIGSPKPATRTNVQANKAATLLQPMRQTE